jgi:GT2 family glycosyltransferase
MALIGMAVYDTVANGRQALTQRTLDSLRKTVDWTKHRMFVVDNGSTPQAASMLAAYAAHWPVNTLTVLTNAENKGTARAVNRAWARRSPGEHALKMDDDVVFHSDGWLDELEEAIAREPKLGIVGLKRKDLGERPGSKDYPSELVMLPQQRGQRWIVAETCFHVMGTCQLFSSALLDKICYLYQMGGLYGFDDSLAAVRCELAGFKSAFLPHIEIDHIDPGGTAYCAWKQQVSGKMLAEFGRVTAEMRAGRMPIRCDDQEAKE